MPRPRVSTNLAISADGKITPVRPIPSGWTSPEDHRRLLDLRAGADALLIGRGTLEADRMTLTCPGKGNQPLRCIVSRSGTLDASHPVFSTPGGDIHLLVTGPASPALPDELREKVIVHRMLLGNFLALLDERHGIRQIHCEGGGQLIRELAVLDVIDDFHLTLAGHTLFGGQEAATATGIPGDFLPASRSFRLSHFESRPDSGECFLSYTRER